MENLLVDLRDTCDRVRDMVARAGREGGFRAASDDQLLGALSLAGEAQRLIDALLIESAGETIRRCDSPDRDQRLSTQVGCRDASELIQRLTRATGAAATKLRKAAKAVGVNESLLGETLPAALPAVREAMLEGDVGVEGVLAIAGPMSELSMRVGRDELLLADRALAAQARGEGPDGSPAASADELKMHAQVWATVLDQDGAEPRETQASLRRGVSLGVARDGLVPIRGNLLPEVAGQLQRIFDAHCSPYVNDDGGGVRFRVSEADDTEYRDDFGLLDDRRRPQKQHDALATALFVAAGSKGLPTIGGAAPTLIVNVRAEDLAHGTGWAHVEGIDEPVSIAVARHVGCAGVIQRVQTGHDGRILRIGTEERIFNRHQRRAIALRDGGCIIPGCGAPAGWCEIHHVTEYARGGPTHTDNGVLLCWHHHRYIDRGPWQLRMNRGVPEVKAPLWFDRSDTWRPVTKSRIRMRELPVRRT